MANMWFSAALPFTEVCNVIHSGELKRQQNSDGNAQQINMLAL